LRSHEIILEFAQLLESRRKFRIPTQALSVLFVFAGRPMQSRRRLLSVIAGIPLEECLEALLQGLGASWINLVLRYGHAKAQARGNCENPDQFCHRGPFNILNSPHTKQLEPLIHTLIPVLPE
jgi:hypothetical protein